MLLLNAFSLNMLASSTARVLVRPATLEEAREAAADSAVGHPDTAALFSAVLGVTVACARRTVTLSSGQWAVVGQYRGPRLPEGATSLPSGATIEWIMISVGSGRPCDCGYGIQ